MPVWAQVIISVAAVGTALGWIFTKAILPGARLVTLIDELMPLLPRLRDVATQWPDVKERIERIDARGEHQP